MRRLVRFILWLAVFFAVILAFTELFISGALAGRVFVCVFLLVVAAALGYFLFKSRRKKERDASLFDRISE